MSARTYELKASKSASALGSAVETARLAAAGNDRATWPYLSILLQNTEATVSGVDSAFMSRQPPTSEGEALRQRLGDLLDRTEDAVSATRIAVERKDSVDVRGELPELVTLSTELQAFSEEHQ